MEANSPSELRKVSAEMAELFPKAINQMKVILGLYFLLFLLMLKINLGGNFENRKIFYFILNCVCVNESKILWFISKGNMHGKYVLPFFFFFNMVRILFNTCFSLLCGRFIFLSVANSILM